MEDLIKVQVFLSDSQLEDRVVDWQDTLQSPCKPQQRTELPLQHTVWHLLSVLQWKGTNCPSDYPYLVHNCANGVGHHFQTEEDRYRLYAKLCHFGAGLSVLLDSECRHSGCPVNIASTS